MTWEQPLAQALRGRRYLLSWWPWRALAYVATTVPIAGVLSLGLIVVAVPLVAVINAVARQESVFGLPAAWSLVFGVLVVGALAPIVSRVVAPIERARLAIVDPRPVPGPRPRGYLTVPTWRQVGYAFWLGGVVPLAYALLALVVLLDATLIASPWLAGDADLAIVIGTTVDTPGQAIPYALLGVAFLPVVLYLVGLVAAGQNAVARDLLGTTVDATALREVTRSRARLVDAYETERRRIERDIHDGAQPRLTSLTLQLGLAKLDVPDDSPAAKPLAIAHDQAKGLMVLLRQIVHGIRPQSLTDLGLTGAVRELAGESTIPVAVHTGLSEPLPELVETTAYFVVSEALGNVARHAGASTVDIRLSRSGADLVVEVEDDGSGGADPARGTGLTGLADRVSAVNGRLLLASPAGGPTLVRVELPCRP